MNDEQTGYWLTHKNACKFYGVSKNTLRAWADNDKVIYKRTPSNQRVYFISTKIDQPQPKQSQLPVKQNVIYCRVSSQKQKDDLERQCLFLSSRYPNHKIIKDIGSGLNYKRRGLFKLLDMSNKQQLGEVVISSKDRLCRFGFELIEWQVLQNDSKIVVLDKTNKSPDQEFTEDILAILQVFACRWNGKRKYTTIKNKEDKIKIELDPSKNIKNVEQSLEV
jgi:predicted site-specific integrase-resolvase